MNNGQHKGTRRISKGKEAERHIGITVIRENRWNKLSFFVHPHQTCRCADGKHWGHQVSSNSLSALSCPENQQWQPDKDGKPLGRSTTQFHSLLLGLCFRRDSLKCVASAQSKLIKDDYLRRHNQTYYHNLQKLFCITDKWRIYAIEMHKLSGNPVKITH